jgi:hypothetical protein
MCQHAPLVRVLLALPFLLIGCAGVGIVATSDPAVKLDDAFYLYEKHNRPLPAEMLIREALAIYEERGDQAGIGKAYLEYGKFFASDAVARWEYVYRRDGFRDKSVTFDQRFAKSVEYLERARPLLWDAQQFDAVTNLDYNLGWSYVRTKQRDKTCEAFTRSLDAYEENIARHPTAKPQAGQFASYPDAVASAKQQLGCQ